MEISDNQVIERLENVEKHLQRIEEKDSLWFTNVESEIEQIKGGMRQIKELLETFNPNLSKGCLEANTTDFRNIQEEHEMSHINRGNLVDGRLIAIST